MKILSEVSSVFACCHVEDDNPGASLRRECTMFRCLLEWY